MPRNLLQKVCNLVHNLPPYDITFPVNEAQLGLNAQGLAEEVALTRGVHMLAHESDENSFAVAWEHVTEAGARRLAFATFCGEGLISVYMGIYPADSEVLTRVLSPFTEEYSPEMDF